MIVFSEEKLLVADLATTAHATVPLNVGESHVVHDLSHLRCLLIGKHPELVRTPITGLVSTELA